MDEFGSIGVTDIVDPHFFPMDRHMSNLDDAIAAVRGLKKPLLDAEAFLGKSHLGGISSLKF